MRFHLEIVTRRIAVIHRDSLEEAIASKNAIESRLNYDRQPGEAATVRLARFADHTVTCDACELGREPCEPGQRMMESEEGELFLATRAAS